MKSPAVIALLAFLRMISTASAEPVVVVRAQGIPIPPGTALETNNELALKLGQHLTLITQTGSTIVVDGPHSGKVVTSGEGGAVDLNQTLRVLISQRESLGGEFAVSRGSSAKPLPDAWLVDVSHSGNGCLLENQSPVFWRPDANATVKVVIAPVDRSWKAEASWPAGEDKITFADVPIGGDQTYLVDLNDDEFAITIKLLPAILANDKMRAAWMINQGCAFQAEALVKLVN